MAVQTPPRLPPLAEPEIEAGVIEDARARQRRQRRAGEVVVAALAVGALLIAGLGGGGGGASRHPGARPSSPSPGGGTGHAGASSGFPGAPPDQHVYGVASSVCPLAAPNRYLPRRSGCVSDRIADVNGDGRPDLIIVYSRLGRHPFWFAPGTEPSAMRHEFEAKAAYLEVVFANGSSLTTRIGGADGVRAAALDAVAHVGADPGDEIFLEINRISSGATVVAYGFHNGRLVPAGILLGYGGDSGVEAGFNCVAGNPPRLIQRYLLFIGPNEFTRSWRETDVVYAWHGPKLVRISSHRIRHLVALRRTDTEIGPACIRGVG